MFCVFCQRFCVDKLPKPIIGFARGGVIDYTIAWGCDRCATFARRTVCAKIHACRRNTDHHDACVYYDRSFSCVFAKGHVTRKACNLGLDAAILNDLGGVCPTVFMSLLSKYIRKKKEHDCSTRCLDWTGPSTTLFWQSFYECMIFLPRRECFWNHFIAWMFWIRSFCLCSALDLTQTVSGPRLGSQTSSHVCRCY